MSKSEDNTNELESYGVWVKNTANNDNSIEEKKEIFDINNDEENLDLPNFDDAEFSDMFKDESQFSTEENADDFGSDLDTTLSTDELANITDYSDVAIENEEVKPEETDEIEDDLPEPIFDSDENSVEDKDTTSDLLEDFSDFEDINSVTEDNNEQEEEISLDDFMDEGFSDDSITSGNNGYEKGAEPKETTDSNGETEEISLDDFLDESSLEDFATEEDKKDSEDEDEPLEMDISFDDSVDSVETEENFSLDDDFIEDTEDTENQEELQTEEISLDDFTSDSSTTNDDVSNAESSDTLATEEIDLSDFGIDADAEETPIVQDVEEEKNKEQTVDYDLFIGNDETSTAPLVNEIKEENQEEYTEDKVESTNSMDNSILQQIVADLSSLKEEINSLKTNIEEIKANEAVKLAAGKVLNNTDQNIDEENTTEDEIVLPEMEDKGGFFSSDDTDETIALSGDELSNIMNNADFSESLDLEKQPDEEKISDQEINDEEPDVISEEIFDNTESETSVDEPVDFESAVNDEESSSSIQIPTEDKITIDEGSKVDNDESEIIIEDEVDSENVDLPSDDDFNFDYENEKLEEPNIDDITIDEEDEQEESLPNEISIPTDEDIFVESTSSDFMDSVKDSTENEAESLDLVEDITPIEDISTVENLDDELVDEIETIEDEPLIDNTESDNIEPVLDLNDDLEEVIEEEPVTELTADELSEESDEELPTIDDLLSNPPDDEQEIEDVPTVDQIIDNNTITEDNTVDSDLTFDDVDFLNSDNDLPENIDEKESIDDEKDSLESSDSPINEESKDFDEIDNLDNELTSSNIDYLTKKENTTNDEGSVDGDLKQEIKSVLLYMDQLLENLPEEKIYEFAKSDEFATYKKLFKDLGLS